MFYEMENGIRAPVSLWNRNTLDGFKEKCTDPASRSTGVSAVMMERTEGFSEQGWAEITLTSRPMTSTRLKLAAKGPFSVRMKPLGTDPHGHWLVRNAPHRKDWLVTKPQRLPSAPLP